MRTSASAFFLASLLLLASGCPAAYEPAQPLLLVNISIVDVRTGSVQPGQTLVIRDGRIAAIEKSETVSPPEGAEVVDAKGKFLIPGLWDMHVHTPFEEFFALYVANGITGVRDTHRSLRGLRQLTAWREAIEGGTLLGPRLVFSGPLVDGPHSRIGSAQIVASESEARETVRLSQERGADFVKVYDLLPRKAYFALAREAQEAGLPFVGHTPFSVSALEASGAGQKSIEHLTGIFLACSGREEDFRTQMLSALEEADFAPRAQWKQIFTPPPELIETYDEEKAAALFARFAVNETWQVPTLVVLHALSYLDDPQLADDDRLRYLPPEIRADWRQAASSASLRSTDLARRKALFPHELRLVGDLHRAGVGILAGTDLPNAFVFPGFSLHDELEALVDAGLPPLAALQTATLNPALYLGRESELGTVQTGKLADLVLLDANPLENISNTRGIFAVVLRGKLLRAERLQEMLDATERAFED